MLPLVVRQSVPFRVPAPPQKNDCKSMDRFRKQRARVSPLREQRQPGSSRAWRPSMFFDPSSPRLPDLEKVSVSSGTSSPPELTSTSSELSDPAGYPIIADVSCSTCLVDMRTHEYALRDAAARFEETRRLAVELSSLQKA